MKEFSSAIRIFAALTILTGLAYPLVVWGIGQALVPQMANGSLIWKDGRVVGSSLVGQHFDAPEYFWGRLSASDYDASASGGTNFGPTNPALLAAIDKRVAALRAAGDGNGRPIPTDLATASGSGLDPHISPAAADFQADRVARARGMNPQDVRALIRAFTEAPSLGMLGEARVNVLELNLALDRGVE